MLTNKFVTLINGNDITVDESHFQLLESNRHLKVRLIDLPDEFKQFEGKIVKFKANKMFENLHISLTRW